jgi:hypothetical protein
MKANVLLGAMLGIPFVIAAVVVAGVVVFFLMFKGKTGDLTSSPHGKGKAISSESPASMSNPMAPLVEIAHIISNGNAEVVSDITVCITDSRAYYLEHFNDYYERGVGEVEWADDVGTSFTVLDWGEESEVCWLGLVDALQHRKYAWEIDWKGEPENVLGVLQHVADQSGFTVVMDKLMLRGDHAKTQAMEPVLRDIARLLSEKNIALGELDIESDSHVLFLTHPQHKQKLTELAQLAKRRIVFEFSGNGRNEL